MNNKRSEFDVFGIMQDNHEKMIERQYREREVAAAERSANEATKANELAEKANRKSIISLWIAGASALFALASAVVAIIALCINKG